MCARVIAKTSELGALAASSRPGRGRPRPAERAKQQRLQRRRLIIAARLAGYSPPAICSLLGEPRVRSVTAVLGRYGHNVSGRWQLWFPLRCKLPFHAGIVSMSDACAQTLQALLGEIARHDAQSASLAA